MHQFFVWGYLDGLYTRRTVFAASRVAAIAQVKNRANNEGQVFVSVRAEKC